jgi:hypothetical protein
MKSMPGVLRNASSIFAAYESSLMNGVIFPQMLLFLFFISHG